MAHRHTRHYKALQGNTRHYKARKCYEVFASLQLQEGLLHRAFPWLRRLLNSRWLGGIQYKQCACGRGESPEPGVRLSSGRARRRVLLAWVGGGTLASLRQRREPTQGPSRASSALSALSKPRSDAGFVGLRCVSLARFSCAAHVLVFCARLAFVHYSVASSRCE